MKQDFARQHLPPVALGIAGGLAVIAAVHFSARPSRGETAPVAETPMPVHSAPAACLVETRTRAELRADSEERIKEKGYARLKFAEYGGGPSSSSFDFLAVRENDPGVEYRVGTVCYPCTPCVVERFPARLGNGEFMP